MKVEIIEKTSESMSVRMEDGTVLTSVGRKTSGRTAWLFDTFVIKFGNGNRQ